MYEQPNSRVDDNLVTLWLKSGGADTERQITLRKKVSTGEWFLWGQNLLVGIREPKSQDPWA